MLQQAGLLQVLWALAHVAHARADNWENPEFRQWVDRSLACLRKRIERNHDEIPAGDEMKALLKYCRAVLPSEFVRQFELCALVAPKKERVKEEVKSEDRAVDKMDVPLSEIDSKMMRIRQKMELFYKQQNVN